MKHFSTFNYELNEDSTKRPVSNKKHNDSFPSEQTINNVLNYAKALDVMKNNSGKVFMNIIN